MTPGAGPEAAPASAARGNDPLTMLARVAPLFALAYAAAWATTLDLRHAIPRDATTLVVGRDFLNFWMAGHAAWGPDPARFYDLVTYQAAMGPIVGAGYNGQVWSYPPSVMLVAAPFGRLPYLAALALWSSIGPIVLYAALRGWTRDRRLIIAAVASPAAIFGLISGQFAYLAAALMLTVLRWRHARPVAAGALLGLLTIKPQLGLFFPLLLLAERNWRAIAAAALVAGMIVGVTALIWGPEAWRAYVELGMPTQSRVLSDPDKLVEPFMPTIFMNMRTIGASVGAAYVVQAVAAVVAGAIILWGFAKPRFGAASGALLFLTASAAGTPYLMSYDTLALGVAALFAAQAGAIGRWPLYGLYFLTLLQLVFGNLHLPGPALIPLAVALYLAKAAASSTWVDQRNCPTG